MGKRRGHRGEGTVYYSKADRRWVARWPLGVVDGKRRDQRVKFRTEREARHELERMRRSYGVGATPASGTLDTYLVDWLTRHRDVEDSTLRVYRHHVHDHISPLLGGIPVARLRAADVDRLIADRSRAISRRKRPYSPTTVRRIVTTLHIALQEAVDRGELGHNVVDQVRLPTVPDRPVPAMSLGQAERLLDAVAGHWLEPIVELLLGSALRLGEAVSLQQGDIFPDLGFVRLRTSKTTLRAVPISDDAAAALRAALVAAPRRGPEEPVFFGQRTGEQLTGWSVSHALPRLLERAGLPRVTPHGLRHGAASIMVADGVHMRVVAEQLGHRNPALTARVYAHVLPESQREAVRSLPSRSRARQGSG